MRQKDCLFSLRSFSDNLNLTELMLNIYLWVYIIIYKLNSYKDIWSHGLCNKKNSQNALNTAFISNSAINRIIPLLLGCNPLWLSYFASQRHKCVKIFYCLIKTCLLANLGSSSVLQDTTVAKYPRMKSLTYFLCDEKVDFTQQTQL